MMAAALVACGWQLRGSGQTELAQQPLRLESKAGDSDLLGLTRQALRRIGARVADDDEAVPVLVLLSDAIRRRTIATDDDGRASAWELEYQLRFALNPAPSASDDEAAAPEQPLIRSRRVTASDTYQASPLATQAEQAQRRRLTEELRDEAVRLMLSQVASALDD
jgi:outer membrane lipopolysaccharide assembly protein LptE/RlpB